MYGLNGRVAVVTGGGSGIGREIGCRLAREGMSVAVLERDREAAERVAAELNGLALVADVTAADEVGAAVEEVLARFSKIDVLVNNAGCNVRKPALDVSGDDWNLVLDTNLRGSFFVAQAFARHGPARLRQNHQHRFRHKCLRLCRHRPLLRQPWRHQAAHNEPCR